MFHRREIDHFNRGNVFCLVGSQRAMEGTPNKSLIIALVETSTITDIQYLLCLYNTCHNKITIT